MFLTLRYYCLRIFHMLFKSHIVHLSLPFPVVCGSFVAIILCAIFFICLLAKMIYMKKVYY